MEASIPGPLPLCDMCGAPAEYDAKTKRGPWAYLCERCFKAHTTGKLGVGLGQRLTTARGKFPPREGDLPRDVLLREAQAALDRSEGKVTVWFKFTCAHCGERCTLSDPNTLWGSGECYKCGKVTTIEYGGFALQFRLGGEADGSA